MIYRANKNLSAFSIVELIVYLGIFTAVSVFAIFAVGNLSQVFGRARIERRVALAGEIAMERITREIRKANKASVEDSVLTLTLVKACDSNTIDDTYKINISSQNITIADYECTNTTLTLTPLNVVAEALTFETKTSAVKSMAVKVSFTIKAGTGNYLVKRKFQSFAILRGSY